MCLGLAAQYEELERLDRELFRAQEGFAGCPPEAGRPERLEARDALQAVLELRARARQMLTRLGDELVAGG